MAERLIARSLSIDSIETQILRFYSGEIELQTVLVEFQRDPRAYGICLDIINRHCETFTDNALPLIFFCSQTLVECDKIYSLCRLYSDDNSMDSDKRIGDVKLGKERKDIILELEKAINLVEQLAKTKTQIFPSLRFLLRAWLRLRLFENLPNQRSFDIKNLIKAFKSKRHYQIEMLAILAQEVYNDKLNLSSLERNELAKSCIEQAPMVFKILGTKDLSIASVYSDWLQLHVKYLDSIADDEQCELPIEVDLMVKSSLSTLISLNLIDKMFEQDPIPIHTITNLIALCPLDTNSASVYDEFEVIDPLVNKILNLIIYNLSKLYKIKSPLFKTICPILLSLSYGHLPYLMAYQFSKEIDNILDGTIHILSSGDYPTREVIVNFGINLKLNFHAQKGWEKLSEYLQNVVISFFEMPLYDKGEYDFSELYSFRESASALLYESACVIGHQFIFNIAESRLNVLSEAIESSNSNYGISFGEIESILFIFSSVASNAEVGKDVCIPTALGLLDKLKYPTQGSLSLLLLITIGRFIMCTVGYIGTRVKLFDKLFMFLVNDLLPSLLKVRSNSVRKDYLLGENALMDAILSLARTSRKIVSENTQGVRNYLICLSNIIQNVQYSIENRIKSVNAAGAIISYMPVNEMKILCSDLVNNLSNIVKSSSNPTDYIQLYLTAIQSVYPMPGCLESELSVLKIVEKQNGVVELLFKSSNEGIIERLSQTLVFINGISKNHSDLSPLFNWTLKLLGVSFKCLHPSYPYAALRSILFNTVGCTNDNWISLSNSLLPSLTILKDSIVLCCVDDKDRNLLQTQVNSLTMGCNTAQLLNTPDSVELCVDCLNVALNRAEVALFLLDRSEFIVFLESLLVILPYIVHPKVLYACVIMVKSISPIEVIERSEDEKIKGDNIYTKKIRLLSTLSQEYNKACEDIRTIAFKVVLAILSTVTSGTDGVETWINVAAECLIALMCDDKIADEAKNAIDSFFKNIPAHTISMSVKNDCSDKMKIPNTLFQALLQLEEWKLWKRR